MANATRKTCMSEAKPTKLVTILFDGDDKKSIHHVLVGPYRGYGLDDIQSLFVEFLQETVGNETAVVTPWLNEHPRWETNNLFSEWLVAKRGFEVCVHQSK